VLVQLTLTSKAVQRWIPREQVFRRWEAELESQYDAGDFPEILALPGLNLATLSLHVNNRDFTWLQRQDSVLARGPFSLGDELEIDMDAEARQFLNDPLLSSPSSSTRKRNSSAVSGRAPSSNGGLHAE
ncbi:unnamed protein product, partial [Amoebophrya sp. A25]